MATLNLLETVDSVADIHTTARQIKVLLGDIMNGYFGWLPGAAGLETNLAFYYDKYSVLMQILEGLSLKINEDIENLSGIIDNAVPNGSNT